jgi:hypothetical protein
MSRPRREEEGRGRERRKEKVNKKKKKKKGHTAFQTLAIEHVISAKTFVILS